MTLGYHVALVGLPGTGKQALGTALTNRLAVPLYDATAATAAAVGMTAAQAFTEPLHGEVWWRAREAETIADILTNQPAGVLVVSPGALVIDRTLRLLKLYAQVLWLHMPLPAIGEGNVVDDAGQAVFASATRRPIVEASLARVIEVCASLGPMVWADQAPAALLADVAARIRVKAAA